MYSFLSCFDTNCGGARILPVVRMTDPECVLSIYGTIILKKRWIHDAPTATWKGRRSRALPVQDEGESGAKVGGLGLTGVVEGELQEVAFALADGDDTGTLDGAQGVGGELASG